MQSSTLKIQAKQQKAVSARSGDVYVSYTSCAYVFSLTRPGGYDLYISHVPCLISRYYGIVVRTNVYISNQALSKGMIPICRRRRKQRERVRHLQPHSPRMMFCKT